jgi:hypothetical protein
MPRMGFNKRRMESERAAAAAKEAEARRALGRQILEDAERLVEAWNARQAAHMPALFSPTIGAAIAARYWYLWIRCPACRMTGAGRRAAPPDVGRRGLRAIAAPPPSGVPSV